MFLRTVGQPSSNRIHPNIFSTPFVIRPITNAMIRETRLPHMPALVQTIREPSFDELHNALERDVVRRCEQRMDVVGHDYEFMK